MVSHIQKLACEGKANIYNFQQKTHAIMAWVQRLFPFVIALIVLVFVATVVDLRRVVIRHKFRFNVIHSLTQCFDKLLEVLFVEENFVLFVGEASFIVTLLALGDGEIIIAAARRFHIEEVSTLTRLYSLGVHFCSVSVVFHCTYYV